jgi:hypothetical protein
VLKIPDYAPEHLIHGNKDYLNEILNACTDLKFSPFSELFSFGI